MTVTVQVRREWPAKHYHFKDSGQGLMFAKMCERDGDYRVQVRG